MPSTLAGTRNGNVAMLFPWEVRRLWLRRHGRQGSGIPSLRVESQTALQLGVQPHPEHGRNPDEIRVASHKNTGNRTVPILSCGGDKQSFTVVLAVKVNGEKLPPKAIFKGVRQLRIQVPRGMQVSVHKKGWMEEEGLFFFLYHSEYIIAATTISSNDL